MVEQLKPGCDVEVDGGIDATTAPLAIAAGANVLVAGSAIFNDGEDVAASHEAAAAGVMRLMRLGIATDHGGFSLKEELVAQLRAAGHEVVDFGARSLCVEDDYPDFVVPLARAVAAGSIDRGVAICGSGVGASVCANKVAGVRAALIHDHFSARQGVEDDHMNIMCMGGRTVGPAVAWDLVQTFLAAEGSRAERFLRRLGKVASLEEGR
jgi:ribose 5-phosphate isomerase B